MEENIQTIEYIKKAFELKEQGYLKPAIEMLFKALEQENDNIEILYQIGELYYLMNNFERSTQYLEKIQSLNPKYIPCLKLLRNIKEKQQDYSKVLEISEELFNQNKNEENLSELVKILLKLKFFDEVEKYIDMECFTSNIKIEYAQHLYKNGEIEHAKEIMNQCADKNDEKFLLLEGQMEYDNRNFDKAKQIFERISKNTQNPETLNFLGLFDIENMDFVSAITHFSKAVNISPSNSKYAYNLGNAYFYNGWTQESINSYKKAINLEPDNEDYRYSLAYIYYDKKDYQKASREIRTILNSNPHYSQGLVLQALLLYENKDFLGAKEILEQNMNAGNNDDFTKSSLAKVYAELNIFDKAEQIISEIIEKNSDNIYYMSDLAQILIKQKKYDNALEIVNKMLCINSNYIPALITGAKISYLKGDNELVKKYAQEIISIDINCASGYYYLALARKNTNDLDEAIECMKRAILYDLNNAQYYAAMSEFYAAKQDYKTAFDYISEAENLDNTNKYKYAYKELAKLSKKK